MAAIADNRRRLADLMERRRVELGLRWKEVAEAGGISYEAIRAVRSGDADLRALTKHGIDIGLRWDPGSVQRIIEGGAPVPVGSAASAPRPPLTAVPDEAPVEAHVIDLMGRMIYARADPLEIKVWETESISKDERALVIIALWEKKTALRAELAAEANGGKSSGTALTVAGI